MAILDADGFTGEADNSFDIFVLTVGGGVKNDDVASLGKLKAVGDFVGEEIFTILEVGHHGLAGDLVGLEEEEIDDQENGQSQNDSLDEIQKKFAEFFKQSEHGSFSIQNLREGARWRALANPLRFASGFGRTRTCDLTNVSRAL